MEPVQPYFWIRRNKETFVPLIPLDELPENIRLKDVSVTKSWEDMCRGEMKFLGDHRDHSGKHYVVDVLNPSLDADRSSKDPDSDSSATVGVADDGYKTPDETVAAANDMSPKSSDSRAPQDKSSFKGTTPDKRGSSTDEHDGSPARGSKYAGTAGTLGKKVYCTYWIRTGNCNYMQEGCKYIHQIPPDEDMRLAIGVRTYPTWPREDPVELPKPMKASPDLKPELYQNWRRNSVAGPKLGSPGIATPDSSRYPIPHNRAPRQSPSAQGGNLVSKQNDHPEAMSTPTAKSPGGPGSYAQKHDKLGVNRPQSSTSNQTFFTPPPNNVRVQHHSQNAVPVPDDGKSSNQNVNFHGHHESNSNGLTDGDSASGGSQKPSKRDIPVNLPGQPTSMQNIDQNGHYKPTQAKYSPSTFGNGFWTKNVPRGPSQGNQAAPVPKVPNGKGQPLFGGNKFNFNATNPGIAPFRANTPTVMESNRTSDVNGRGPHTPRTASPAPTYARATTPAGGLAAMTISKPDATDAGANFPDDTTTVSSTPPPNQFDTLTSASMSPIPYHRRRFLEPGQDLYVANPPTVKEPKTKERLGNKMGKGGLRRNSKGKAHAGAVAKGKSRQNYQAVAQGSLI